MGVRGILLRMSSGCARKVTRNMKKTRNIIKLRYNYNNSHWDISKKPYNRFQKEY